MQQHPSMLLFDFFSYESKSLFDVGIIHNSFHTPSNAPKISQIKQTKLQNNINHHYQINYTLWIRLLLRVDFCLGGIRFPTWIPSLLTEPKISLSEERETTTYPSPLGGISAKLSANARIPSFWPSEQWFNPTEMGFAPSSPASAFVLESCKYSSKESIFNFVAYQSTRNNVTHTARSWCVTIRSSFRFSSAILRSCTSIVPRVTKRYTTTSRFWPSRWARSIAWISCCGFQSESYRMTVSAALRLIPNPPERVVKRKIGMSSLDWKSLISWSRSPCSVEPWMEQFSYPRNEQ